MIPTVVIMAGGRGLRLHPLTEHCPKPMLKLGVKPMLQEIIEHFALQGFKKFKISVNYKAEVITDYFGDGSDFAVRIDYIHEKEPLGTAGSLRILKIPREPIIVMNADIITEVNFRELMGSHNHSGALATACLALYQEQIPYGVAKLEGNQLLRVEEKPIINYPVLAGIYVLSPGALKEIPRQGPYDMTDLITKLAHKSGAVHTYELKNHWQDIGTFQDFSGAGH